jgi:hypothetical protein
MSTTTAAPAGAHSHRETAIRAGLAVLGASSLLTALLMVADPSGFLDEVGGFGAANDHLVRDVATWVAAYGAALLVAVRLVSWRVPVLALGVAQGVLHAVNHLADAGIASPSWKGLANVAVLGGITLVTAWLLVASRREERA